MHRRRLGAPKGERRKALRRTAAGTRPEAEAAEEAGVEEGLEMSSCSSLQSTSPHARK